MFSQDEEETSHLSSEIVKSLVKRPEDMPQQVEENLTKYRNSMLRIMEVRKYFLSVSRVINYLSFLLKECVKIFLCY